MILPTPRHVMPVYYCPTTIPAIDDNIEYLNQLEIRIGSNIYLKFFYDPNKALNFLNKQYKASPFIERCLRRIPNPTHQGKDFTLELAAIINEIYNPDRFKQIYTIIIDFSMPGKNGIEFRNAMENSDITAIMLTGEAGYLSAKKAFDNREIDQFLRKDEKNLIENLLKYIYQNIYKAFEKLSFQVVPLLTPEENNLHKLFDPLLIQFLNLFMQKNQVCEYYLFDKFGSYLMLDRDAHSTWLLIRSDKELENSIKLAEKLGASDSILKELKNGEKLLSVTDEKELIGQSNIALKDYLHPVKVISGSDNVHYYYAFVEELPQNPINKDKILSFNEFLNSEN